MRNGIAYRLQPLVRRTDENVSGLWRTPSAQEPGISPDRLTVADGETLGGDCRHYDKHTGRLAQNGLSQQVKMRLMWPTPNASDVRPRATAYSTARRLRIGKQISLEAAVKFLSTPTVQDASNNGGPSQYERNSLPLNAVAGGSLNPTWVEWLMGFPLGWTALDASATPSSRKSSKSSGGRSLQRKRG
jgi:hypothetical protein